MWGDLSEKLITHNAWLSINGFIAQANEASRGGNNPNGLIAIENALKMLTKAKLDKVITVKGIPYAEGTLFQLSGLDGHGYAYTIGSKGVIFEAS